MLHENKNEKSARQNEKQIQNRNAAWKQKSKRQTKVHAAWIIKNANQKVRTSKVKRLRTQKVQTQTSSQKKFSKELPSILSGELEDLTSLFYSAKWEGQDQETANNATQTTQETEKGSTNLLN